MAESEEDDKTMKALQKLLAKRGNASSNSSEPDKWSSLFGPKPGLKWRGGAAPSPPPWKYDKEDVRAWSKYQKKVDMWVLQAASYMSKKETSLALYASLQGELEQELEHMPMSQIYHEDGITAIMTALRQPMEQKLIYQQKRKFLREFEVLRRLNGKTMRTYIARFRRSQRCPKAVGVEVSGMFDQEALGSRLLDRSGLSAEAQRGGKPAGPELNFERVAEALDLSFNTRSSEEPHLL